MLLLFEAPRLPSATRQPGLAPFLDLKPVETKSVPRPELHLVGVRTGHDDLLEHLNPFLVCRPEQTYGPISSEDNAVGTESVQAVIHRWGQVLGAALRRQTRGHA